MNILKLISLPVVGATLVFILFTALVSEIEAQGVKYCKNATTGDIITVQENMPCPYPTHEI
jgi:hypothetical protein